MRTLLAHGAQPGRATGWPEQTPLTAAVNAGFAAALAPLAQAGARLERADPAGISLIHLAASLKSTEVVDVLVSLGLQVDARDPREAAPAHYAAASSDGAMISHLLQLGAGTDSRDRDGLTPLHYALRMGNVETAEELMKSGADVTTATLDGWTALHFAAQRHLEGVVERLIARGVRIDEFSLNPPMTPLQAAAESGATAVVKLLLAAGADPRASSSTVGPPLVLAVRNGHYAAGELLIEAGASPRGVDPVSGVGPLELFYARRARQQALGLAAEGEKMLFALTRASGEPAPAPQGPLAGGTEPAPLTAEPADAGLPPEEQGGIPPDARAFAPLWGVRFIDPQAPIPGPWQVLRGEERSGLLEQIRVSAADTVLDAEAAQVAWAALPFYKRVRLLRVRDRGWAHPRRALFYLKAGDDLSRLDGTSPPIHLINTNAPVRLDARYVTDYLRFFSFFVRGERGPFYILESLDDQALAPMPEETRELVLKPLIRPARPTGMNESGYFLLEAVVAYSNALFVAHFAVQPNGMVEMLDDDGVVSDLPVAVIDAPIT
jgi:ankyrin repeat protein